MANTLVTLHRVSLDGGAPVDSAITDGSGTYRFRGVEFDSLALFVASSEYAGIAYFTAPVPRSGDSAGQAEPLFVYDTSSVVPAIFVLQRHVIVSPTEDGEDMGVLELVVLENSGSVTRVSPDSVTPVWFGSIPQGAMQFQLGESEVSNDAITLEGNVVHVVAPLPPGTRQIVYSYLLPRGARIVDFDLDQGVGEMNFLIDTAASGHLSGGLNALGSQEIGTKTFLHYEGENLSPGLPITLHFAGPPIEPGDLVPWLVALVTLVMVGTALLAWRGKLAPAVAAARPLEDRLAGRIAALDHQFESLDSPTPGQQESYRRQRGEMKEILRRSLARGDHDS